MTQPNLRAAPIVYDPFAVTTVDAVLSTHYHNDHIDPFFAAAVMQNCEPDVPFIGPLKSVEKWLSYGVPEERCRIVKPGDVIQVKDCEIVVLDSFDRTCLVTADEDIRNTCPNDMDEKAVNYLLVYETVREQMRVTQRTIERVSMNIMDALYARFPQIRHIRCTVSKLAPPLGGKLEKVSVVLEK